MNLDLAKLLLPSVTIDYFEITSIKEELAKWYNDVETSGYKAFNTISKSIYHHYETISTTEVQMLLLNLSMPK